MADWRLLAVGRFKSGPERSLWDHFSTRLRPPLKLVELPEGRGTPAETARREGEGLLAALPDRALLVALDPRGEAASSERLAELVARWGESGRPVCLAIGGAGGLDEAVLARADHRLSLGPMTWPHLLVRGMLAEQLYRARTILSGHPYHRG